MKLSVCVLAYNHEKYIRKTLESIFSQKTNFEFEVIIGEDGSKDQTLDVIKQYTKENQPKNLILKERSPNRKIYIDGRPTGIQNGLDTFSEARGQYIAFLEGDDFWTDETKLQKSVDYLDATPKASLCFHDANIYDQKSKSNIHTVPNVDKNVFSFDDMLKGNFIPTCTIVFRNHLINFKEASDLLRHSPMTDWPIYLLLAKHGQLHYFSFLGATYRIHPESYWESQPFMYRIKKTLYAYKLFEMHFADESLKIKKNKLIFLLKSFYHLITS